MKYIILDGINIKSETFKFNAGSKARDDSIFILKNIGFKNLHIEMKSPGNQKHIFKFIQYIKNTVAFDNKLKTLSKGDTICLQYPLLALNLNKILHKYCNKLNIIILIHDLDYLRGLHGNWLQKIKAYTSDKALFKSKNCFIIAHNPKMIQELIKYGVSKDKIVNLEIFDYIYDGLYAKISKDFNVIIAGNLEPKKAGYLSELKNLKNVNFNLYGSNFDDKCLGENISYKGKFLPDELILNLEGSFGLVWDGNALDKCGGIGEYLKYNNPHKTSLYLAAGLPVIIWKEAALSEFIIKNNLGIAVDSLYELEDRLKNISDEEYAKMLDSVKVFSHKIRNGEFLKNALAKIVKD